MPIEYATFSPLLNNPPVGTEDLLTPPNSTPPRGGVMHMDLVPNPASLPNHYMVQPTGRNMSHLYNSMNMQK